VTVKPVIFISSTSDLSTARDLVGRVLYSMGYEPVWQDIEPTDGGELLEVLRKRLAPCSMVLQLVGTRYGAEPPHAPPEFGRVSYTQFEALYAQKLGKKVVYHFIDPGFPTDPAKPEPQSLAALQAEYKRTLVQTNRLRQSHIASAQDLELSIRRISDDLASLRKQADRRFRRILWLVGSAAVGVAIAVAMVATVLRRQAEVRRSLEAQRAEIRAALSAALAPQALAQGQTAPPPLPPQLLEKARLLLERGSAADQALAKIALKQYDQANQIIQQLKAKPGNPLDETFRLLTMEGDNWYQAGEPDKAVTPYEQCVALRPGDVKARNHLLMAHTFARLGDLSAHRRRAVEVAEGTLRLVPAGSEDWAMTQNNLAIALADIPAGDQIEDITRAIAAYEAALTVFTKQSVPARWANTQNNLGTAWEKLPTVNRSENLHKAVEAYEAALSVYRKENAPSDWANTQSNLGIVWCQMPTGNKNENLEKSIACFEAALNEGGVPIALGERAMANGDRVPRNAVGRSRRQFEESHFRVRVGADGVHESDVAERLGEHSEQSWLCMDGDADIGPCRERRQGHLSIRSRAHGLYQFFQPGGLGDGSREPWQCLGEDVDWRPQREPIQGNRGLRGGPYRAEQTAAPVGLG
jgi:tetratricopeptide (TPR) repeat protein